MPDPFDLRSIQQRRNADSRDRWERFAPHRQRVTAALLDAARLLDAPRAAVVAGEPASRAAPRLCVLGAGNCNDLDLSQLVQAFGELHLVDIDGLALQSAAERQNDGTRERLRLHGDVDLSGLAASLARGDGSAEQLMAAVESTPLPSVLDGTFDVVASICTLTQILEVVLKAFEPTESHFVPLVQALRLRHLRQLTSALRPGGRAVLITDVVSSETCGELATAAEWQLPGLLQQLVATRNFFTGVNPFILWQLLATGGDGRYDIRDVRPLSPWTWDLGPRVYAVCGWTFTLAGPVSASSPSPSASASASPNSSTSHNPSAG